MDVDWQQFSIPNNCHRLKSFCDLFNINIFTVKSWLKNHSAGKFMFEKSGQPRLIDDQEMKNVVKLVENSALRFELQNYDETACTNSDH